MFKRKLRKGFLAGHPSGRERGQALVEFALVLGLFLILLMGIVDFGLALSSRVSLTNAAREGARLGAVQASSTDIQNRVQDTFDASSYCPMAGTATVTGAQGQPGDTVTVTVQCDYKLITPLGGLLSMFGGGIPDVITLTSTSKMRLE